MNLKMRHNQSFTYLVLATVMMKMIGVHVFFFPGPAEYGPGEAVGAPDHPHRGFEVVTYIIEGGVEHKDSAGNTGNT